MGVGQCAWGVPRYILATRTLVPRQPGLTRPEMRSQAGAAPQAPHRSGPLQPAHRAHPPTADFRKSRRFINEPVLEVHAFVVGDQEKSEVRIEKERKQLLGCRNRLYVNNRLVRVFSGV